MRFREKYAFMSNMHRCLFSYRNILFTSVEQAFVYMKCALPEDRDKVLKMDNPVELKRFGRTILLREDWDDIKVPIMYEIVRAKFEQNPNLAKRLIMVRGDIVEENTWGDTFWGTCNGQGSNHLGNILSMLREELMDVENTASIR